MNEGKRKWQAGEVQRHFGSVVHSPFLHPKFGFEILKFSLPLLESWAKKPGKKQKTVKKVLVCKARTMRPLYSL